MSPPTRLPADPQADVAVASRDRPRDPSGPTTEIGSAQAAVVVAQQTAGNQAVASVLGGGGRGVQRAPNDDPPPDPALSVSTRTIDSSAPGPLNVSTRTLDSSAPGTGSGQRPAGGGSPAAPSGAPQPAQPAPAPIPWWTKDPRFAVGGEYGPKPVGPGMAGGVGKAVSVDPTPVPVNAGLVDAAFRRDPSRVIRSPNPTWHDEAWDKSMPQPKKGEQKPPTPPTPQMFTDGRFYYVAPDYRGSATDLPAYAAVGGAGSAAPAPGGVVPGGTPPGGPGDGARPMARMPPERPENRLREAVSPETPAGPRGNVIAQRVRYQEVDAAYAANPNSVVRSPNDRWHGQGFRLDGGDGKTPGAYKVGNLYVISPGYPLDNVPYLTVPGSVGPAGTPKPPPTRPSELPQAAQLVALPGTTYSERSTLKSYSATTTEAGGRTETRTRSREQAVVTNATEVSQGGLTNRTESQRGAGFGVGGNVFGFTTGRTESSKIDEDVVGATKAKQVSGGVTHDAKLAINAQSTKEIVVGRDPEGNPIKKSTSTTAGAKADLDTLNLTAGRQSTNEKGTTRGVGAGVKADRKGNAELELNYNIQSKGGLSFKPTVSRGVKVEASDPVEVEGGFEITYRIADTTGVGAGGGKQFGGGPSVGINVGATKAEFQGGKRAFKTKKEAEDFRDNAATRVASERMFTPNLAPTTVAGALQIPMGETRTSGDISGRSIGGSIGHSGVAVSVGKSSSTTNEVAIKRTGDTIVEVTGSVAGSKSGSVGISAPVLSHGYSSTNTTSFAVTFEFDLSKEQGRAAFELYCRTGFPPGQAPKVIERAGSDSDHETVTIPGLGSAVWTGTTWQVSRETADGSTQRVYGGAQTHEQKPGRLGKAIGEDTLKSNASIVRVMKDGEEVGARAQLTVGGTSGDYNRNEFGKIFMGARTGENVKPSGEWTLSAPVPKERIRELEQSSKKIRNALDEREAYSELVKENGAQMLGGQVGMTSKNWDLELKGDPNFPGEKERTRLKQLRKDLMARVRSNPEIANDIVRETGEELAKLVKRREAVADTKRYSDLPDGLRQQQLSVIDMHVDDMKVVRRTAQAVAMKRNPGEKATDVAARVEKGGKGDYAEVKKPDLELAKLQDKVSAKESQIAVKRNDIRVFSKALGDAIGAKGTTAVKFGADSATVQVAIASGKGYIGVATEADRKQAALDPKVEQLRDAWSSATDPKDKLEAIKALEKVLDERLKLMESCLFFIREAGKAVFHIATRGAKSGNPAFWGSLGETEGEE